MPQVESLETLTALAKKAGYPLVRFEKNIRPAIRLVRRPEPASLGSCRLGGLPDLPPNLDWPRWNSSEYDEKALADAKENDRAISTQYTRERLDTLRKRGIRSSLPLAFMAQLNLSEVPKLGRLPLPKDGMLYFFYELSEQLSGYDPIDEGSFRVLYSDQASALHPATKPEDLHDDYVFVGHEVGFQEVVTIPDWPDFDSQEEEDAFWKLNDLLPADHDGHQIGGHPEQIQGDMPESCSLVTKGIYLGRPPNLSVGEEKRLLADSHEWRLLLQLASDDDLEWMWGDAGNLYWWIKEGDLRSLNFEDTWFQFQCS